MKGTRRCYPALGVFAALLLIALAGCGSGAGDKAGGSNAPVVLRLAASDDVAQPDSTDVRYFAQQVGRLSHGRLQVKVIFSAAGQAVPNTEALVARMVSKGQFDLGWIGSRAWDELGVKSFQALQAPFLITDQTLLDTVTTSPLAAEMLSGLHAEGVEGLALVPGLLRHPVGLKRPLISLKDFAGARIRVIPSQATDATIRALGAIPVYLSNAAEPVARQKGEIDAEELSFGNAQGDRWVTANVTFFGKTLTLFASQGALARLNSAQRTVLREAAAETLRHVIATIPSEAGLARAYCSAGRVALASHADVLALERAAQPVYTQLEANPQTARMIAAIRRLKQQSSATRTVVVAAQCSRPGQPAVGAQIDPSALNGTYRWVLTEKDARAFGPPATDPGNPPYPTIATQTMRDGKFLFGPPFNSIGTYKIAGQRIVFISNDGTINIFAFSRARDGTLHLKPVLPMDRGDQFIWTAGGREPWRRIGPPVAPIP